MSLGMVVLGGLGLFVLLLVLDLMFLGGAGSLGMLHGSAMMASNPLGQAILLVLLAILGILVYALFFR